MQHGDVSAAGEGTALRDLILAQTHQGAGVPVLLRTAGPAPGERRPFGAAAYRTQVDLAVRLLEDTLPARTDVEPGSLEAQLLERPVLAINFHRIRGRNQQVVRDQLARAAALGRSFDLDAPEQEPGEVRVLVGFYDGFARTAEFAADLCHELGLRALFFPIFFAPRSGRLLTDAQLADFAREHEVGWHTASHASAAEVTEALVEPEVVEPFRRIERVTGRAPRIGAWRGGTRFDDALPGNRALRDLGLTHVVSNWSVERV
ncbi:polysaccharide deacetylase family protein [Microlunatus flavus]|uniref:Polysaccharide deacetylase n=1 Tax=Microlunatus flavus TaxID=1036181 RepID=A0A1H9CWP5_9ACTN|nr:polysaccharide deacetylase family protein [Microlunatus flavus]SEQ05013.1 Polysaccharide deacetylase [Microlunatus flavus]